MRKCSFIIRKAPYLTVNEKNELKVTLFYESGCRVLDGRGSTLIAILKSVILQFLVMIRTALYET